MGGDQCILIMGLAIGRALPMMHARVIGGLAALGEAFLCRGDACGGCVG